MADLFNTLKDHLLRAGVRPSSALRYVTELRGHLDDLVDEGIANGLEETAARQQALARIGSMDELAQPMIAGFVDGMDAPSRRHRNVPR
ncbi:permease prefix domain 1-containing protein [Roseinatronobacter alkalisoli]|uniref:Permease prefix domain 1-containing protein n=1 Tax=Roseinatronobacter alkalisoli TaxID=3028235 RepID=A0ABT5TEE2_9RHOB|nr:permease prefix domain 1-containing protein [Roseinatronobacter sp. HJB301]MDD7973482.1 permease prefix domain 1-containing protein [Roseinatronobacter sp. HJB301]